MLQVPSHDCCHEACCALQAGLIPGLAKLVKQGDLPAQVRDALSEALKHLTASSQKNRNTLVSLQVLPLIIAQLQTGHLHHLLHQMFANEFPEVSYVHHAAAAHPPCCSVIPHLLS